MSKQQQRERRLPSALSPSTIELYQQCPRKFEAQKIAGIYEPPGIDAILGTFVHLILEHLMGEAPSKRNEATAKDCARRAWDETKDDSDFLSLGLDEAAVREFKWRAWQSVLNYLQMEDATAVDVVATEQKVTCDLGGVPVRGIIDRLDRIDGGHLVVSDYKNGKVTPEAYMDGKRRQLNLYGAMVEEIEGTRPIYGRLIYTAHSEITSVEFTDSSIGAVIEETAETWESIKADFDANAFKPRVSGLCGWCPALATCPDGMAQVTMQYRRGRLKQSAPGYSLVAEPQRQSS